MLQYNQMHMGGSLVMESYEKLDPLTEIYSFRAFLDATREMIDAGEGTEYILLVWDIEHFKIINDLFGMETGDEVLKTVAGLFARDLKGRGTYGRIGNDKFVCCFPQRFFDMDRFKKIMNYTIIKDERTYMVRIQAGIYYIEDSNTDVIKMCDRAMMALNRIKGRYSERIAVYSKEEREVMLTGQQLVSDMEAGIEKEQFKILIQPVYRVSDNRMSSGEVLVRWEHPKYGLLMPGRFIPVFEKSHCVTKLDRYVWEQACILIRNMIDEGNEVIPLSINVSRIDIMEEDIIAIICGLVEKYDIPADYLRIEITESAYMDNPERLGYTIDELKSKGFIILMDDFGTGYSSLNILKDLSFDVLKIDKKLIDEIDNSEKAGNVVISILKMAKWLGMKTVAEGIENSRQANMLRNMGCDYIQGFLYAKPLAVEHFLARRGREFPLEGKEIRSYIDLDNMFAIDNPETRAFVSDLIGPLALYEYDEATVHLIQVNNEYCRMFHSTPNGVIRDIPNRASDYRAGTEQKVVEKCRDAFRTHKAQFITISRKNNQGKWMWLYLKISYIGNRNQKQLFLFSIDDVTKDQIRKNKQQTVDYFPLLRQTFSEIVEMNYTDDTMSVLYKHGYESSDAFKNRPLGEMLKTYIQYIVAESDRDFVELILSREKMDEFFREDNNMVKYNVRLIDDNHSEHQCEMTIIKNEEDPGKMAVMACTRVVDV